MRVSSCSFASLNTTWILSKSIKIVFIYFLDLFVRLWLGSDRFYGQVKDEGRRIIGVGYSGGLNEEAP